MKFLIHPNPSGILGILRKLFYGKGSFIQSRAGMLSQNVSISISMIMNIQSRIWTWECSLRMVQSRWRTSKNLFLIGTNYLNGGAKMSENQFNVQQWHFFFRITLCHRAMAVYIDFHVRKDWSWLWDPFFTMVPFKITEIRRVSFGNWWCIGKLRGDINLAMVKGVRVPEKLYQTKHK